jgi:DNA-binding IclR family transcriptional regulator
MPPEDQGAYLRDAVKQDRNLDKERIARSVVACREHKFITMPNPEVHEISEISAPVFGLNSENAVAALTMPYLPQPSHEFGIQEFAAEIIDSAKAICARIKVLTPSR